MASDDASGADRTWPLEEQHKRMKRLKCKDNILWGRWEDDVGEDVRNEEGHEEENLEAGLLGH